MPFVRTGDLGVTVPVSFKLDGRQVAARAGDSLATAILVNGEGCLRRTRTGAPRSLYCGIGLCWDCLVTVDGAPNVRACLTTVREGMDVQTDSVPQPWPATAAVDSTNRTWRDVSCDLLIVGGGPGGMAAAIEGACLGLHTILVDERPRLGGQIYRQPPTERPDLNRLDRTHRRGDDLIRAARRSGAEIWSGATVWALWPDLTIAVHRSAETVMVRAAQVVLATGAADTATPFNGWTLPGVVTAGAAQNLMKTQGVAPGARIVVVGAGPQVLAFSADLVRGGAHLLTVAEASPFPRLHRIAGLILGGVYVPELLSDGLGYYAALRRHGVPILFGHGVLRAEGHERVESVTLARYDSMWRPIQGSERQYDADALCVGYGFTPSSELASMVGADLERDEQRGGWCVKRDRWLQTTVDGVAAAGDGAGIGGALSAQAEGQLAALGAALKLARLSAREAEARARPLRRRLTQLETFRGGLARVYPVAGGILDLAGPDTVICRCEELTKGRLLEALAGTNGDPGTVKSISRAGMGLCQGRNCAQTVAALVAAVRGSAQIGRQRDRFPVRPVPIADLAVANAESAAGH